MVENGAVIVLNYVKDDSQTQKTRYTVKHVVDGVEQTDDKVLLRNRMDQ